ncbi:MAG: hypothetical protein ACOX7K_06835 [Oscillospiraceae bacterium]|jgi:predicted small lipoprotein YifL
MKKLLSILLTLTLLLGLCACSDKKPAEEDKNDDTTVSDQKESQNKAEEEKKMEEENDLSSDAEEPTEDSEPEEPEEETPPVTVISNWEEIYTNFLSENYDRLMDSCSVGIVGVGFIDLDMDGIPELLLFDSGSSAAMGVQFFDIVNGTVTCVSANVAGVGEAFGGDYLSNTVVNTNYFKNFRLMLNNETGEQYFCIDSSNGAMDFYYRETIQFSAKNGVLSLSSLFYTKETFQEESTEVAETEYKINGETCTMETYQATVEAFYSTNTDTQYSANGVFTWDGDYSNTRDGLLSMTADAAALYTPIV